MLNRQYGVAASSSIVKVAHPEDSQPNEGIQGRNRHLPPKLNTVRPPRFDRIASNSSRMSTQVARRGSWNTKLLPTRIRQEALPWPTYSGSRRDRNVQIVPEALPSLSHSNEHPAAAPPAQPSRPSALEPRYRSISPKLPPEPIRRRTPQDPPRPIYHYQPAHLQPFPPPLRSSSPLPLPGRKRKAKDPPPFELPPPQKLKFEEPERLPPPPPLQAAVKPEPVSPEPIVTSRRLVNEACNFWPTPDNCRKSVPNHSENRKAFAKAKIRELATLGLRKTKAFFREDGLVIEWRSDIAVWSDTLLPERPQSPSTPSKKSPNHVFSINTHSVTPKRKRSIEIIDVDALPTENLPSKKSRPSSDLGVATAPGQSGQGKTPSPKKVKGPGSAKTAKHWSAGLSKEEIQRLGRGVEASSLRQEALPPTSSTAAAVVTPSRSCDARHRDSVVTISPTKRPALPTRLTPSERKIVAALHSTTGSGSPGKKAMTEVNSGANLTATANSTSAQETKPLADNDIDPSVSLQSTTFTTEAPTRVGKAMDPVDIPASMVAAASSESAEQHAIATLKDNDGEGDQKCGTVDEQVASKADDDAKHDGPLKSEAESQEIERLCTELSVDLPEYEMAEDFLRRFISFFDTDRSELKKAYSSDALLSFRVPGAQPGIPADTPSSESTLHFGRTEIIDKLNGLIGYYFSPVGEPSNTIHYDIAVLSQEVINSGPRDDVDGKIDKDVVGGILATLHSQIVRSGPGLDETLTLHQSFVLRRRRPSEELDDDGLDESTGKRPEWPLIVVSHHMILGNEPLLPPEQLQRLSLVGTYTV